VDVAAAVERLWPDRGAHAVPLSGGITNHNFKVDVRGDTFVLRMGGAQTGLLGIDRRVEHEASLRAAEVGLGPEVTGFLEECRMRGGWSTSSPPRNVCYRSCVEAITWCRLRQRSGLRRARWPGVPATGHRDYIWKIGRTSMAPTWATGHLAAYATASSRSLASIT
jgi:hypothetical protein